MKEARLGISIRTCEECETMNTAIRIMRALQFFYNNETTALRGEVNFRTAIGYDQETKVIVIDEELLMQAIIMANPGQEKGKLRLVSHEEYQEKYKRPHKRGREITLL